MAALAKGSDPDRPVVSGFQPATVKVKGKVTVRGSGFVPGRGKNTVVFLGRGGGDDDVAVRATRATRNRIVLRAPRALSGRIEVRNRNGTSRPSATSIKFETGAKHQPGGGSSAGAGGGPGSQPQGGSSSTPPAQGGEEPIPPPPPTCEENEAGGTGAGVASSFEGLEKVSSEARSRIGHDAYTGPGFEEFQLLRKVRCQSDSSYQLVRASSDASAGVLSDGERAHKGVSYVYRTDVVTEAGRLIGADKVTAVGAADVASVEGWAQLEENCANCGSSSVQAGTLRSTVASSSAGGPGDFVGQLAVYEKPVEFGWHPSDAPAKRGTLVSTRILVPLSPSEPGTHLSAQLNLTAQHPATMRGADGTTADLRDSTEPWISVEARHDADGSIEVLARDSEEDGGTENVIAKSGDLSEAGLQNIYLTVQISEPGHYEVRYKANSHQPEEDQTLVSNRPLPGGMSAAWLTLGNEMSRSELASHDVRFDDVFASYQFEYHDKPDENFGGVGENIELPAGFDAQQVVGGIVGPTAIDFDESGDMFVALRDGKVLELESGGAEGADNASELKEVLDIEDLVNSGPNDQGLTGFVLDPNFEANHFFYVYYTVQKEDLFEDRTVSRVARFHVGPGGTAPRGEEKVLVGSEGPAPDTGNWETSDTCPPGPTSECLPSDHYTHSAGGLVFGADGDLWISTPDGATPDGLGPQGTDPLSLRAIDPDSLAGKILRVDPATGEGVPGNPEYATQANKKSPRARTWAMGFRNPFRIAERPNAPGSWYATDVGWGTWEELDVIPGTATAGVVPDYGWPCYEGTPPSAYSTVYPSQCNIASPQPPLHQYDSSGVDHAIIGSTFYTGTAYPAPWKPGPGEAAFYYGDYPSGEITMVETDSADQVVPGGVKAFAAGFTSPVMITEGPTDRANPNGEQTLYIVDLGGISEPTGKVWRVLYSGP